MLGKGVCETSFLVALIGYWGSYWAGWGPMSFPLPETLLGLRVSNAVAIAAGASFITALCFAITRRETDAVEVFRPYGLILFGGGVFLLPLASPWIFFGEVPSNGGLTARLFRSGMSEAPSFSLYIALFLSIGSFGLYLVTIGVRGLFSEIAAKVS